MHVTRVISMYDSIDVCCMLHCVSLGTVGKLLGGELSNFSLCLKILGEQRRVFQHFHTLDLLIISFFPGEIYYKKES